MARYKTEIENLKTQQKDALDRIQALEADASKLRELALKLQGAIEVLEALEERENQEPITPEVVE